MRRTVLLLLFLLVPVLAQVPDQNAVEIARQVVQQWLDGKLSKPLDFNELSKLNPEQTASWLRDYLAFPPPPPDLQVNLDDPKVSRSAGGLRVSFPATLSQRGGEVVVILQGDKPLRINWLPNGGMIPAWVKSDLARLLFAAASILLALALLQGGLARTWRAAWVLLAPYKKLYVYVNLLLYGLFVLGALAAYATPQLAQVLQQSIGMALENIGLQDATKMGVSKLAWVIFYWNFSHGLLLTSYLPALLLGIPALLINMGRYLAFGFALSPAVIPWSIYVYHLPTLLLELQGYILVTFGGLVLLAETLRGRGFRYGVSLLSVTLLLGTLFLIAGAWYEAFELLYLLK